MFSKGSIRYIRLLSAALTLVAKTTQVPHVYQWKNGETHHGTFTHWVISRNEVTAPNGNQPQIQDEAKKNA